MESFQVTAPFLRTINRLQRYIRGSHVATLLVTDAKIEFFNAQGDRVEVNFAPELAEGSSEGSRIPLFHEDLQRIGYLAIELEKVDGEDWGQQMDYLSMYNWNAYAKHEMMDRFEVNKFKGAWRITLGFSPSNALLVMTKESFTSLLEEAQRNREEE
ncbi:4314_t:CDS:2, partial [Dentiscutata heterogama]